MLSWALESTGLTDSEITGSGTNIEVIASRGPSETKVSPVRQSMPKSPTMSPALAGVKSSILSACIRTRRPIFVFLPVRVSTTVSPFDKRALVDPQECELAVAALVELEGVSHGLRRGVGLEHHRRVVVVQIHRLNGDIGGAGEVVVDRVHQKLHALVFVSGANQHRGQIEGQRAAPYCFVDQLGSGLVLERSLQQFVREEADCVEHVGTLGLGLAQSSAGISPSSMISPLSPRK